MSSRTVLIRIAALRRSHKMTQEELSEILNVSIKHMSAVERGISSLSFERPVTLCGVLDTDLDYLVRGIEKRGIIPACVYELFNGADERQNELLREYLGLFRKVAEWK